MSTLKRTVFGADLRVNGDEESGRQRQANEWEIGTRPSKMGHRLLVVMYPVSLRRRACFEIDTNKRGMAMKGLTIQSRETHGLPQLYRGVLVRRPSQPRVYRPNVQKAS